MSGTGNNFSYRILCECVFEPIALYKLDADKIIAQNRDLIFEFSPPVLKEAGLNPALYELAKNILELHKISLIHAVKRSETSNVNIIINRKLEIITASVEDNGTGMLKSSEKIFGLFSIREQNHIRTRKRSYGCYDMSVETKEVRIFGEWLRQQGRY